MIEIDVAALTARGFDADAGLIDLELVGVLLGDFGVDLIGEIAESLVHESEGALTSLAASGDPVEAGSLLHFMRGSALNCGLTAFAAHCERLEAQAKAGTLPSAADVAALAGCFTASRDNLTILVASLTV